MKRVIIATFTGALVAFFWGFITWMLLDWHTPETFKDEAAVTEVITANAETHGIYMLPRPGDMSQDREAAFTKGPFVYAIIRPGSLDRPWNMVESMLISFGINVLCCLVISVSVLRIRATRYISRASVGATLGLFAALSVVLPHWQWFETPGSHFLAEFLDPIIAYTLAGLVIAAIIKTPKARRIFS
ncbi:hypothetical protein NT6N_22980 [Oceaniferula spumae]|uniref:Uncharacterized protein n=1 Tax=Oceaniferula spumae TaxID=2979115 RepID=A0AAT9FMS9_9BACT